MKKQNMPWLIFQSVIRFVGFFLIALLIVILIIPGPFETKIRNITDYVKGMAGIHEYQADIQENPVEPELNDTTYRATVSPDDGKIKPSPSIDVPDNIQIKRESGTDRNVQIPVDTSKPNKVIINNYYFSQLDPNAKIMYEKLRSESGYFLDGAHTFDFGNVFQKTLEQPNGQAQLERSFQAAINALFLDYPQLFFVELSNISLQITSRQYPGLAPLFYTTIQNAEGKTFYFADSTSKQEIEAVRKQVEDTINKYVQGALRYNTEYERIKYVHDALIQNLQYDTTLSGKFSHNLYGAVSNGVCVCEGYAKLFKYIMDRLQIPTITVVGDGFTDGRKEPHAWNYVYIDNAWYGVDTTFDDPVVYINNKRVDRIEHKYFLAGKAAMDPTHIPNGIATPGISFKYPPLANSNYIPAKRVN